MVIINLQFFAKVKKKKKVFVLNIYASETSKSLFTKVYILKVQIIYNPKQNYL